MIPANDNSNLSVDEAAYALVFGMVFIAAPAIAGYCAHVLGWF